MALLLNMSTAEHCPTRRLIVYSLKDNWGRDYRHLQFTEKSLPRYLQMKHLDRKPARERSHQRRDLLYQVLGGPYRLPARNKGTSFSFQAILHQKSASSHLSQLVSSIGIRAASVVEVPWVFLKARNETTGGGKRRHAFLSWCVWKAGDIIFRKGKWLSLCITCGNEEEQAKLQ